MKGIRRLLVIGSSLTAVGALLFAGAMAGLGFDFAAFSTRGLTAKTCEIDEDFDGISINAPTTEIVLRPSGDGTCRVEFQEEENVEHYAAVQSGTLTIGVRDARSWYDRLGISFENMRMTVYLPRAEWAALRIETETGDVEIPDGFTFETVTVSSGTADIVCRASVRDALALHAGTGNVAVDSAGISGSVDIGTKTGNIRLSGFEARSVAAESHTGDLSLEGVVATGGLSISSVTGDVRLEGCDAAWLSIGTNTGSVVGRLLTAKVFVVETATGHISVPQTTAGGKCEITTGTGNVDIRIG